LECVDDRVEYRNRLAGFEFGFECIGPVLSVPCRTLLVLTDDGVVGDGGAI